MADFLGISGVPLLGREVVERQQAVSIFGERASGLGVLGAVDRHKAIEGGMGICQLDCEKAEHLRNSLAHSQYDLTMGESWDVLIDVVQTIETTIMRSDDLVEAYAKDVATYDLGALS